MNNITSNIDLKIYLSLLNINNVIIKSKDHFNTYPKNGSYIINLADSDNNGTHWTALYIKDKIAVYFDSYGLAPPKDIQEFVKVKNYYIIPIIFNPLRVRHAVIIACCFYIILTI
jgi:hypothetical protein